MTIARRAFRVFTLALMVALASMALETPAFAEQGIIEKIEKALKPPPPPPRPPACACVRG